MKFKTSQASEAYKEVVEETSKVAADMCVDLNSLDLSGVDKLHLQLVIENFRQEALARAILTASTVEVGILGLQGGLAIASLSTGKE